VPNTFQSVAIPNPDGTLEGHQGTLMALKEAVELLLHQRDGAAAGGGGINTKAPHSLNPVVTSGRSGPMNRTQLLLDAHQPMLPGIVQP